MNLVMNLKLEVHSLTRRRSCHPVSVRDGKKFESMLEKRYGGLDLHGLGVSATHDTVALSLTDTQVVFGIPFASGMPVCAD